MHRIKFIFALFVLILISVACSLPACSLPQKLTKHSCFDGKVLIEVESLGKKSTFIVSFFSAGTYKVKLIYDKEIISSVSNSEFDLELKEIASVRKIVIPIEFRVLVSKIRQMRINISFKEIGKDSVLFEEKYFGPNDL